MNRFRKIFGGIQEPPPLKRLSVAQQSAAQAEVDSIEVSAALQGITAAEEACAGMLQRAMSLAELKGSATAESYFDVPTLMMIGRDLVLRGESFYVKDAGYLRWYQDFVIRGNAYYVGNRRIPNDLIFHPRYITNRLTGRGESAMFSAKRLKLASLQTEGVIENESRSDSAQLIATPYLGDAKTKFEDALERAKGNNVAVEIPTSHRQDSGVRAYQSMRIGMNTPENIIRAYETMYRHSLNAMGVMSLFTDGNDKREGIRLTLHTFIKPYAKIIEGAAATIGIDLKLGFASLMATDIQAKARAFAGMVASGMDEDLALELSGLNDEIE